MNYNYLVANEVFPWLGLLCTLSGLAPPQPRMLVRQALHARPCQQTILRLQPPPFPPALCPGLPHSQHPLAFCLILPGEALKGHEGGRKGSWGVCNLGLTLDLEFGHSSCPEVLSSSFSSFWVPATAPQATGR